MQPNQRELQEINKQLAELRNTRVSQKLTTGALWYLRLAGCTAVLALVFSIIALTK